MAILFYRRGTPGTMQGLGTCRDPELTSRDQRGPLTPLSSYPTVLPLTWVL